MPLTFFLDFCLETFLVLSDKMRDSRIRLFRIVLCMYKYDSFLSMQGQVEYSDCFIYREI